MADIIIDTWAQGDCTLGRLVYGDFHCFTLELPWLDNKRSVSCVPDGRYVAHKYNSPSKGSVLLLDGVPDRSYIEIHVGNYTRQIEGCILVGDSIRYLDTDETPDVANSRNTMQALLDKVPNRIMVEINRVGNYP